MQTTNNFQNSSQENTDNLDVNTYFIKLFNQSSQQGRFPNNSLDNTTTPNSQSVSLEFLDNLIQQLQPLLQNQKQSFKKVIKRGIVTKNKHQCSICQQFIPKDFRIPKLQCKHIFHFSCLKKWYQHNTNCPLCRRQLVS